ncbi:uncharacterized protein DS421_19g669370 [Arachis hypogaea]|uniref:Uncharacterized protein n=1 Tax=Arachis hypogaea TaxID=3818 RepID=A0A6B9VDY2_ARAHY|nr:uncharacterized protein DS421_19g669370 [Arachis hypogaea]
MQIWLRRNPAQAKLGTSLHQRSPIGTTIIMAEDNLAEGVDEEAFEEKGHGGKETDLNASYVVELDTLFGSAFTGSMKTSKIHNYKLSTVVLLHQILVFTSKLSTPNPRFNQLSTQTTPIRTLLKPY